MNMFYADFARSITSIVDEASQCVKSTKRFQNYKSTYKRSLERAVQNVFGTLSEDWFSQMYVKWVKRLEQCVTAKGEYFLLLNACHDLFEYPSY